MPLNECHCIGEPDCVCDTFKLRKGELRRVKFIYITAVTIMAAVSTIITITSLFAVHILFFIMLFVTLGLFVSAYLLASAVPEKYTNNVCIELAAMYKDFGMLRWRRTFILLFDITIASFALMVFTWDLIHNIVYISNGVQADDTVPLMYLWDVPEWEWTLLRQGWLDFFFALAAGIMIVSELMLWFDHRLGNVCSLQLDDMPFPVVGDYQNRVDSLKYDWWGSQLESMFGPFIPKKDDSQSDDMLSM